MTARVEAAAKALADLTVEVPYGISPVTDKGYQEDAAGILAAADAVMFDNDALNRVQEFLDWFDDRSDDIAADFPSGPSLYVTDLGSLIAALKGDDA